MQNKSDEQPDVKGNIGNYLNKERGDHSVVIVKALNSDKLTSNEKRFDLENIAISDDDFRKVTELFESVERPVNYPTDSEVNEIHQRFPSLKIDEIRTYRTKSLQGTCRCGREVTVYDILTKALSHDQHSTTFLEGALNGVFGQIVVSGRDIKPEDLEVMPSNTVWIENTSPVPCVSCGHEHDVLLNTVKVNHFWKLGAIALLETVS